MKKLLLIFLTLAMMLTSVFALASCNTDDGNDQGTNNGTNNEDNSDTNATKVDYTVNVIDQDGNPVAGVPVELYVGPAKDPIELTTNTNGIAVHKMKETNLPIYAALGILPEGYGDGEATEVDFAAGSKTATIEVVKQVAYKVSFLDADGKGIAGVGAQVCVGDSCLTGKTTGETGILIFYVNPGSESVSMQINEIPEEYAQTLKGQKQYYEAGSFEITVTLDDAV